MLRAYLALLGCQMFGEVIQHVSKLPLSGPIIGMVLLLIFLRVIGGGSDEFNLAGQSLLRYLPLFFVPPGVGVMQHFALMRTWWLPTLLALIASTALAMMSGAIVMQSVTRLRWPHRAGAVLDPVVSGD
jgi:holin-like protein